MAEPGLKLCRCTHPPLSLRTSTAMTGLCSTSAGTRCGGKLLAKPGSLLSASTTCTPVNYCVGGYAG